MYSEFGDRNSFRNVGLEERIKREEAANLKKQEEHQAWLRLCGILGGTGIGRLS